MQTRVDIVSGRARLAASVAGEGTPVIFLHANVCDSRMWHAQIAAVAAHRKAIAYDRRGFGQTRYDAEDHSAVADLMAVIGALAGGQPAVLVACSQGARIAVDTALLHPHAVAALVLVSASIAASEDAPMSPECQRLMAQLNAAQAREDLDDVNALKARLFLDGPLAAEGRVTGAARDLFLQMNGQVLNAKPPGLSGDAIPAFARLNEIAAPTLVMWGDLDFPHIQARCRTAAERVAKGTAYEIKGTAHLPSLDQPDEVTRALLGFLNG